MVVAGQRYKRDHPRVCGEHIAVVQDNRGGQGSSPRVRGTRSCRSFGMSGDGIIPACAGNTAGFRLCSNGCGDHPRVCGEHMLEILLSAPSSGSSPRVRGTPECRRVLYAGTGIIPACAGNTARNGVFSMRNGDHPRVCGEHQSPSRHL